MLRAFMSRVPIGLVLSPGGLVLGLVFIPHILTQTQAAFDPFGSAVYNNRRKFRSQTSNNMDR